jgi:hypothetical protein
LPRCGPEAGSAHCRATREGASAWPTQPWPIPPQAGVRGTSNQGALASGQPSDTAPAWPHTSEAGAALAWLGVGPARVLGEAEAARRLVQHGPNELVERGRKSPGRIAWQQLTATVGNDCGGSTDNMLAHIMGPLATGASSLPSTSSVPSPHEGERINSASHNQ